MILRCFFKILSRTSQILACWLIGLGILSAASIPDEDLSSSLPLPKAIAFYFTEVEKNLSTDLIQAQIHFLQLERYLASSRSNRYRGQYFRLAGRLAFRKKAYARATRYYFLALEYLTKSGNTIDQTRTYLALGNIYLQLYNPQKAIKYFQSGLNLVSGKDRYKIRTQLAIQLYLQISKCYSALRTYNMAFNALEKVSKLAQDPIFAPEKGNLLLAYGSTYKMQKQYDQAFKLYDSAWTFAQKNDLINIKIDILEHQSLLALERKQATEALHYAIQEKKEAQASEHTDAIANSDYFIAQSFLAQGQLDSALRYNTWALEAAKAVQNDTLLFSVLTLQSKIVQQQGDINATLQVFDQLESINKKKDSKVQNEKSQRLWEEMTILRTEEEAQKRLESRLEQQISLRYLLTFLGVLILLGSLFFFIQAVIRNNSNKLLNAQNQQIVAQNEQLEDLNEVKDQLFTIISHDLRSPLLSILTSLKMIEQLNPDSSEREWYMQILNEYAVKTRVLLENLLQWANIQMNKYIVTTESFLLSPIISEVQEEVDFMYRGKAMVFKNEISPNLQVRSDPGMIRMAIRNLLVNAVKFSNPGQVIEISTLSKLEEVRISVKDHGIGMNDDELNKALNGRLSRIGTQAEVGTGIGLSLVRQFLQRQNGRLEITSTIKKGSTFTIVLPQQAE